VEKHKVQSCGTTDQCRKDAAINKDKQAFDEHVVPPGKTFDLDDIVEDDVTPYLTLEVDGLTSGNDVRDAEFDQRLHDSSVDDESAPDASSPMTTLDAGGLEVYGWESSWWRKMLVYLGLDKK
jgi:hypothetical protein